jgi:hypothetical protein
MQDIISFSLPVFFTSETTELILDKFDVRASIKICWENVILSRICRTLCELKICETNHWKIIDAHHNIWNRKHLFLVNM